MKRKFHHPKRQSHPVIDCIEILNRALPPLPDLENRCLLPGESAQMYYARMESFRKLCEARTVLCWMAGGQFDVAVFITEVIKKRGVESASVLKTDLVNLFHEVIKRDPSLHDLLHTQLKLCCVICYLPENTDHAEQR